MNKEDFLKRVAESAYNIGFGAKKHFASYDMIMNISGIINFIAITVGIFSLIFPILAEKFVAAIIVLLGVVGVYMSQYNDDKKKEYDENGIEFTNLFNKLKDLYFKAKSLTDEEFKNQFSSYQDKLSDIENIFYRKTISKQVLLSDWFAHYKFFWQMEINWINEVRPFKFFRDKMPLSLSITVISLLFMLSVLILFNFITINCNLIF